MNIKSAMRCSYIVNNRMYYVKFELKLKRIQYLHFDNLMYITMIKCFKV